MDRSPAVRARALRKSYDDVVALDGVDLDVAEGQVHGLIGPNGAGKTTLLGLLLGLSVCDAGSLELLGTPVRRALALPSGVAGFLDGPGLYPALTARQNLTALARLRGDNLGQVQGVLDDVGLSHVADDRVRGFSLGMRQRLGLAAALLARPRLLVLDEPTNGLDPAGARHVRALLAQLAADGTAVVVSSHRMDDLAAMCAEVTVLRTGRVVFSGPVGKLLTETGPVAHRLRTSDPAATRRLALQVPGIRLDGGPGAELDVLVVRGAEPSLDELVARLVTAGVAVRELAPLVPPLEAAFLALTAEEPS